MSQEVTSGGKDKTLVKGAGGAFYIVDKHGTVTTLTAAQAADVQTWIADMETKLSNLKDLPPTVSGGVNLCVPDIFP